MEERIMDEDELYGRANGRTDGDDASGEGAEQGGEPLPEMIFEVPEGDEYDEDLVGLTPEQLEEELERRKKAEEEAHAECERLLAEGEAALSRGAYDEAEPLFAQALLYDPEDLRAGEKLWIARTRNFRDDGAYFVREYAEELASASEGTRNFVLGRVGEKLNAMREERRREAEPIEARFNAGRDERREAFARNRNYYLVRFLIFAALVIVGGIGAAVSSGWIYRTQQITPFVLIGVFGIVAFAALIASFVYARKLLVAWRLCRENEKLSSTEEGARLAELKEELACLDLILDGAPEE